MNVASIALETGYESEAAFSRAFKRFVGVPPGTWRRSRTATTAAPAHSARKSGRQTPATRRSQET